MSSLGVGICGALDLCFHSHPAQFDLIFGSWGEDVWMIDQEESAVIISNRLNKRECNVICSGLGGFGQKFFAKFNAQHSPNQSP